MTTERHLITVDLGRAHRRLADLVRNAIFRAALMDKPPSISEAVRYALEQLACMVCSSDEINAFDWIGGRMVGLKAPPRPDGKIRTAQGGKGHE